MDSIYIYIYIERERGASVCYSAPLRKQPFAMYMYGGLWPPESRPLGWLYAPLPLGTIRATQYSNAASPCAVRRGPAARWFRLDANLARCAPATCGAAQLGPTAQKHGIFNIILLIAI